MLIILSNNSAGGIWWQILHNCLSYTTATTAAKKYSNHCGARSLSQGKHRLYKLLWTMSIKLMILLLFKSLIIQIRSSTMSKVMHLGLWVLLTVIPSDSVLVSAFPQIVLRIWFHTSLINVSSYWMGALGINNWTTLRIILSMMLNLLLFIIYIVAGQYGVSASVLGCRDPLNEPEMSVGTQIALWVLVIPFHLFLLSLESLNKWPDDRIVVRPELECTYTCIFLIVSLSRFVVSTLVVIVIAATVIDFFVQLNNKGKNWFRKDVSLYFER